MRALPVGHAKVNDQAYHQSPERRGRAERFAVSVASNAITLHRLEPGEPPWEKVRLRRLLEQIKCDYLVLMLSVDPEPDLQA